MQIGYDPDFIGDGIRIPLPTFGRSLAQSVLKADTLRDERFSDHIHFTLAMNEHTRQLIYSAYNIDQTKLIAKGGGLGEKGWANDKAVGKDFQLDNEYYKDRKDEDGEKILNPYDKGHMVMRFNNMWGDTRDQQDKAGRATFVYSNASLQHENLNRDEWKTLEIEIIRKLSFSSNGRLAVFTGPIFGDLDRHVNLSDTDSARVPGGFFKVICFRLKDATAAEKLGVLAFAIFQDPTIIRDRKGASTVKTDRRYQVTITELQRLTGINFGRKLFERNPLFYFDLQNRGPRLNVPDLPERIPINELTNIVSEAEEVRLDRSDLPRRRMVINSAMIKPSGPQPQDEWISLHNRTGDAIDLAGWVLVDGQGRAVRLSGVVESGESLRLAGEAKGKVRLADSGGSLMLHDNGMQVVDHATWSGHDVRRVGRGVAYMFERAQ